MLVMFAFCHSLNLNTTLSNYEITVVFALLKRGCQLSVPLAVRLGPRIMYVVVDLLQADLLHAGLFLV
jgi:hypothetical protein